MKPTPGHNKESQPLSSLSWFQSEGRTILNTGPALASPTARSCPPQRAAPPRVSSRSIPRCARMRNTSRASTHLNLDQYRLRHAEFPIDTQIETRLFRGIELLVAASHPLSAYESSAFIADSQTSSGTGWW